MREAITPTVEVAGHRDADTGEIDLVVYVDGKPQESVLWHIFDITTWPEEQFDGQGRIPQSLWRAEAHHIASMGSPTFSYMVDAYSTIDEKRTASDLYPAADAQLGATDVDELDPRAWYAAANRTPAVTAMSAAHGVVALCAFRNSEGEAAREKAEEALCAYRAATHYRQRNLTDALIGLLSDLRQFADAREIRLEGRPHKRDTIACALAELLVAVRENAVSEWWAGDLGLDARAGSLDEVGPRACGIDETRPEDVYHAITEMAYRRYFEEITREP
ncbi:hypothetical protein JNUCC0626_32180 [Lentzea sp. JNUCC 0626]|uniref:hypothetical protein n=1 Tax=Lentzea sp. JNUCC 0626 TaxID=3367513 RepID=UPI003747FF78